MATSTLPAQVVIVNKRRHKVTVGIYDAEGKLVSRHLGPLERTEPLDAKSIAPYTKQLAATMHLDLIPAV